MRVVEKTDFLDDLGDRVIRKIKQEGFTTVYRNEKGQFISEAAAIAMDLRFFISEWKRWAIQAIRNGDPAEASRCYAEMTDCRKKLNALAT